MYEAPSGAFSTLATIVTSREGGVAAVAVIVRFGQLDDTVAAGGAAAGAGSGAAGGSACEQAARKSAEKSRQESFALFMRSSAKAARFSWSAAQKRADWSRARRDRAAC